MTRDVLGLGRAVEAIVTLLIMIGCAVVAGVGLALMAIAWAAAGIGAALGRAVGWVRR